MSTTEPIRKEHDIYLLKELLINQNYRDYCLFVVGINIPLRISDLLRLKWNDVYDYPHNLPKTHLRIFEKKTQKQNQMRINHQAAMALMTYREIINPMPNQFVFSPKDNHDVPLSRVSAYKIIKKAATKIGLENVSCHSLRKTFGYQAMSKGANIAVIMEIYNHSSYEITRRYLGIDQDEKDRVFELMAL
ncbi:MAG: tyrosine-type recombinase/integrase [Lachnospiraceae bacterium]|nr:tyrosine-type recombinase/integrase [Lachnospiraceae bacterium]MBQ8947862.1 tyrosine-type recombinase/integrase [Lachnospiraceae bacterium]